MRQKRIKQFTLQFPFKFFIHPLALRLFSTNKILFLFASYRFHLNVKWECFFFLSFTGDFSSISSNSFFLLLNAMKNSYVRGIWEDIDKVKTVEEKRRKKQIKKKWIIEGWRKYLWMNSKKKFSVTFPHIFSIFFIYFFEWNFSIYSDL